MASCLHATQYTHLIKGWGEQGVSSQTCGRLGWTRLEPSIATLRLNMFNSVAILTDDNIQVQPHCYKRGEFDIHNSTMVDIILSQFSPVYTTAPQVYKIHFNINIQPTNHNFFEKSRQTFADQIKCTSSSGAQPRLRPFTCRIIKSSVLSDLCYELDSPGIESQRGGIFRPSRSALGPTQPPVQ